MVTMEVAAESDSPYESREKGRDKQFDAYWRLDCPTSGATVEAFWPDFGCWLPAKFLRVNADGSFNIQWKSDSSTSTLPDDHVRKLGDKAVPDPVAKRVADSSKPSASLMRLLRKSRAKWSDRDVYAAAEKLKSVDILEVDDLLLAVEAELRGEASGVNQRLQRCGLRSFAEATLKALLRQRERETRETREEAEEACENQPPEEERPSKPQRHGAFSRQALKPQQVFSYEEEAIKVVAAEELPGTGGLKPGFLLGESEQEERLDTPVATSEVGGFRWKNKRSEALRSESPGPAPAPIVEKKESEEVVVYCPKQHALRSEGASYVMDCDRCGKEISTGEKIWWCGLCGYNLCPECHAEKAV